MTDWEFVGAVGVDSAQILIGDPCYFLTEEKYKELINIRKKYNWKRSTVKLPYKMSCGIVTSSGYGDGVYNVYIKKNDDGRVMEAKIVFM